MTTRREFMQTLAEMSAVSKSISMQSDSLIKLGDGVELDENASGEPVVRHVSSGQEFRFNSSTSRWELSSIEATDTVQIGDLWVLDSEMEDGSDRLRIQATGANDPAELFIQAKGSADESRITVTPDSSSANFSSLEMRSDGSSQIIESTSVGNASTLPLRIKVDGSDALRIADNQNTNFQGNNIRNIDRVTAEEGTISTVLDQNDSLVKKEWVLDKLTRDIDDFEDDSLSEWSGDTGAFTINSTSPVPNGDFRLECTGGGNSQIISTFGGGLNYYPGRGDEIYFQFIPNSDEQAVLDYLLEDNTHYYRAFLDVGGGTFEILERDGSSTFNNLVSDTVSYTIGQEYRVEILPGEIDALRHRLIDLSDGSVVSDISTTDSSQNGRGIGIEDANSSSTGGWVIDYLRAIQK